MILRISLYAIAAAVLGAHFLRGGNFLMVALCLAAPLLFFWRQQWSLLLLQILAYGASATWLVVAYQLIALRQRSGQPWTAAAVILGSVALFTLVAGLLLNSRAIRSRYPD